MYKLKLTDVYKQLREDENQAEEQRYKIYCDMDGVLCDFNKRFTSLNPEKLSPSQYDAKYGREKFWNFIDKEIGVKFWVGIPWMKDGKELWNYIKKYNPTILSAPSQEESSKIGKRVWKKNNLPDAKMILTPARFKQKYAGENKILIDDMERNIQQWRDKGGIGILHTSAADTIKQLKELGL